MPSKLFQKRKAEAARRATRNARSRADRKRVLLVAEGSKTEPNYLSELLKIDKSARAEPFITRDHNTGPMVLLKQAREILKKDPDFDFAYVISDRDEFQDFDLAKNACDQIVSKPKIKFIYSDPCVEFWFILHFELFDAPLTRQQALSRLKTHISNYEKDFNGTAKEICRHTDEAIANSTEVLRRSVETGNSCPSTNMHELIIDLRS